MKINMTPQERFKKTITHQQVDCPPILGHWVPEVGAILEKHFETRFGKKIDVK